MRRARAPLCGSRLVVQTGGVAGAAHMRPAVLGTFWVRKCVGLEARPAAEFSISKKVNQKAMGSNQQLVTNFNFSCLVIPHGMIFLNIQ